MADAHLHLVGVCREAAMIELYLGDARSALAGMPAESAHCVVTSPPYWGLRKYANEQELVWGGRQDCAHEWGELLISKSKDSNRGSMEWTTGGNPGAKVRGEKVPQGQFCGLCGAWQGAFGNEPTPELYLAHSIEVLRAIRWVLRSDGTVFWNIDDSRAGSGSPGGDFRDGKGGDEYLRPYNRKGGVLKPTDLCLIPQRLVILAQEDGWYVHSDIIWAKDSTMPESVKGTRWEKCRVKTKAQAVGTSPARVGAVAGLGTKPQRNAPGGEWQGGAEYEDCPGCPKCAPNDGYILRRGSGRPTDSYEHILVLSKTDKYFWDSDGYREPLAEGTLADGRNDTGRHTYQDSKWDGEDAPGKPSWYRAKTFVNPENGRNVRSVWRMNPEGYKGGHFAVFPSELPRRAILLGTSAKGCCPTCGAPWARVVHSQSNPSGKKVDWREKAGWPTDAQGRAMKTGNPIQDPSPGAPTIITLGWRPTCAHPHTEAETQPATVLDPFMGTGTTLAVALELGRSAIGIDISEAYIRLAQKRLRSTTRGMRI